MQLSDEDFKAFTAAADSLISIYPMEMSWGEFLLDDQLDSAPECPPVVANLLRILYLILERYPYRVFSYRGFVFVPVLCRVDPLTYRLAVCEQRAIFEVGP